MNAGHRAFWELTAAGRPVAWICWLGGVELLVEGEHAVRGLLSTWARAWLPSDPTHEDVEAFLTTELPLRLPGAAARSVEPRVLPAVAGWMRVQERRPIPALGEIDPEGYRSNIWPDHIELQWLFEATTQARVVWTRGSRGGYTAGGREDLREQWLTLSRGWRELVLVVTLDHAMPRAPVRESRLRLRPGPLGQLHRWLGRRLRAR